MATAAVEGLFRCVYEGCISGHDAEIERRPYHRNCGCALHNSKSSTNCSHGLPKCNTVSYPIRRSRSEGCLALRAFPNSSPSSSPAAVIGGRLQMGMCKEEQEED